MRLTKFSTKWDSKMIHKNETHKNDMQKNFTKMRLIYTMDDPRNISRKLTLTKMTLTKMTHKKSKNEPQK